MTNRLTKTALAVLLLGTLNATAGASTGAESRDQLPDMGTSAGGTLSIGQELAMGDFYVRQLRASAPLINDPLLSQYINQLGDRLVASAYSVRTPFHFYLVRNDRINAFAFFGGNVVLHSALFASAARKPAGFGTGARNLARHPAPRRAQWKISSATPADTGGRTRHPAGDGQPDHGHGGAERHRPVPSGA